jgi:mannose-6-phosphate isomerase-like protein (cupin superfamily)
MSLGRRIRIGALLAALFALALVAGAVLAQGKPIVWPTEAIKWTDVAGTTGRQAVLWGDPAKGGYGALKQVTGGTVLPLHTHKNDSRVLIIRGTVVLEIDGRMTALAPGSFAMIPGGLPHAATCQGKVPCEYFEEMSGAFDSTPVKK